MSNFLGRMVCAELYGCNPELLKKSSTIETHMRRAALVSGATIVQSAFKQFQPWGVSGVVIIAESHLAIHTWPEYGYAAVDYFTCGDVDAAKAIDYLRQALGAERIETAEHQRGDIQRMAPEPPRVAAG